MFWIIGENGQAAMPATVQADVNRLQGNNHAAAHVGAPVYHHQLAQVQTPLGAILPAGEPIILLTHAGYEDRNGFAAPQPWMAGRWFDEFAQDIVTRFTAPGLTGRTLLCLVCLVGDDVQAFATQLAGQGVTNVDIYMPTDFMYISANGIPHVLPGFDDVKSANREVAKYDSEFSKLTNSLDSGKGWAGARIDAHGNVAAIPSADVVDEILTYFDPNEDGEL